MSGLLLGPAGSAAAGDVALLSYAADDAPVSAPALVVAIEKAAAGAGVVTVQRPFSSAAQRLRGGAVAIGRLRAFRRIRQLAAEGWRAYLSA